jgi:catechol 2,3-dioxygenase-like lactoylglutathione lyase family enzyme
MYIEHLAIWCKDLETMKDFYVKYFDGVPKINTIIPINNSLLIF